MPTWHRSASADDLELPPGGTFVDDDGNVHEPTIEALAHDDITRGCGEERYCPERLITRGEIAAMMVRALELPRTSVDHFVDDDGHLFEDAINRLAEAGITRGCGDGSGYCPDDQLSRGQLAALFRRAQGWEVPDTDTFVDDDDSVFEGDIEALAARGITSGCNPPANDRFCPTARTTRAQMATFISRLMELPPLPPPPREFSDVSVDDSLQAWFPEIYDEARAVVRCESRFNPAAVNPSGQGYHGLFQISAEFHRAAFQRVTGQDWDDAIYTAYYNSQYARHLYDQTGDWRAWSCQP